MSEFNAEYDIRTFGAVGDGRTDDTAAFQKALDAVGKAGGGVVHAPRGNYRFAGHLNIPVGVTLKGVWESVPAHNGIRDAGLPKPTDDGTTFLVTGSAGDEAGPPFITLNHNSTLKGVVLYYPNQDPAAEPKPYPYAIAMRGKNPAVLAVELLNPYNGIDATQNERHLVRDVHGQPLRRGIFVDTIYDIGRIENVHFNPWWSMSPKLLGWQYQHGEAFIFAKTDWQYVFTTFCYGYAVGYKFVKTEAGDCNGNFLGLGADDCLTSIEFEAASIIGVLITNGQFVSYRGPDPTMVRVGPRNEGSIRFVNSAFWGACNQVAVIEGTGTVGFSDCTFLPWGAPKPELAVLQYRGGSAVVRGCEFREDKAQVFLGPQVKRAIVADNLVTGRLRIQDETGGRAIVKDNAADREG